MGEQQNQQKDFGKRLKHEREKQNLTQQTLAAKAHTKQDYIAQLERGARNPTLNTLKNILSALDVSADSLLQRVDESDELGSDKPEREVALKDFIDFLSRRDTKDILVYYDIVRFISRYLETGND